MIRRLLVALCVLIGLVAAQPRPQIVVARATATQLHPLGLVLPAALTRPHGAIAAGHVDASLPASADLSSDLPAVGDQGKLGSCVSWAEGYYIRGWYAEAYGDYPAGGFAPMYLYSQVAAANGGDVGSSLEQPAQLLEASGISPESTYFQGYYDFADLPTATEHMAAAPYHIAGYQTLWMLGQPSLGYRAAAEDELAAGRPIVLAIGVYSPFDNAGKTGGIVGAVPPGQAPRGYHAIVAYGYTPDGLRVRNQWGASWGAGGDALLTWSYLDQALVQVEGFGVAPPVPPETATPIPSATNTPLPATSTPSPTSTPRPSPTSTPGIVPWPHAAAPALPAGLPKGTYSVQMEVIDSYGRVRALARVVAVKR